MYHKKNAKSYIANELLSCIDQLAFCFIQDIIYKKMHIIMFTCLLLFSLFIKAFILSCLEFISAEQINSSVKTALLLSPLFNLACVFLLNPLRFLELL